MSDSAIRLLTIEKLSKEEQNGVDDRLDSLRAIRATLSKRLAGPFEFFQFGLYDKIDPRKQVDDLLDELVRACYWNAIVLKIEYQFKLLYSIEAYLGAVEGKNPVSTFLLARYLLELAATVSAIEFQLDECVEGHLANWKVRLVTFMTLLWRARNSTSDEGIKAWYAKIGIAPAITKPFHMSEAIKRLASRPGFAWAHSEYGTLSNICHHNGSGHFLFFESIREANAIDIPSGGTLFVKKRRRQSKCVIRSRVLHYGH
jgi:hypothetical protein